MLKAFQFAAGLLLLIAIEVLKSRATVGVDGAESLSAFVNANLFYLRTIGYLILAFPTIHFYWQGNVRARWLVSAGLVVYIAVAILLRH
jgi:hypothetical protein